MRSLGFIFAINVSYLATLSPGSLSAQVLRDATIPVQSPLFESTSPDRPRLTPIQFRSIPKSNVAPPPMRISPLPINPLPQQYLNVEPLRIQPLSRDPLPRDYLQIPRLNSRPLQLDAMVIPPLVQEPLSISQFNFNSSILGYSSRLRQAYDSPPDQQRVSPRASGGTYTAPGARNNVPRQPGERRARQPLGW